MRAMAVRSIQATSDRWRTVAEQVKARRDELDITVDEVVRRSRQGGARRGISSSVVSLIENAKQEAYAQRSLRALSSALEWSADSIERIIAGGEPVSLRPVPVPALEPGDWWDRLRQRIELLPEPDRRRVEQFVEGLLVTGHDPEVRAATSRALDRALQHASAEGA